MSAEQKNDVRKLGILCLVVLSGNRPGRAYCCF